MLFRSDKHILVERHLISREHAAKNAGSGFVLNREETLCVMINEEDHLRMQALRPGLQLKQAWQAIDAIDTKLEKKLDYAFHVRLVGSVERRVRYIEEYLHLGRRAASEYVRKEDLGRKRYVKKYYGRDIDDPLLYDLVIKDRKSTRLNSSHRT